MTLHPVIAGFLATLPPSDATPPDVDAWRANGEAHVPPLDERQPAVQSIEDRVAHTAAGDVPLRVYSPAPSPAEGDGAEGGTDSGTEVGTDGLLLYFHGGAFFSGSLETHDAICRSLAAASGWTVVSVGYRLAPEHAFPAGLDDCLAALRWAAEHPGELGWSGARLAVAGDSSGGTFAAVVAAMARDAGFERIDKQVLLYPSVDLDFDINPDRYPSLRENAVGYGLETVGLKPHNSFYLESGADPADPRVSPIKRESLAGLPEALVITAEFDPLRDEGEAYAARLADAGVATVVHRYEGATHGFAQHWGFLPEYQPVFAEIGEFLNRA